MNSLSSEAFRLIFKLDEQLEPLEDCYHCPDPSRVKKLCKVLLHASLRYYRRRKITQPSPYSMIEMILTKAKAKSIPIIEFTDEEEPRPVNWTLPQIKVKLSGFSQPCH